MSKGGSSGGVSTGTGKIVRSFQQAAPDSGSVPKDVMLRATQAMMATTDVGGFSVKSRDINELVGGIRYAYVSGSGGREPSQQAIEKILNKRFSIPSSKPQGKGAGAPEDSHTVAQINVRHAISDAYAAGQKHEAAATAGPAPAAAKKPEASTYKAPPTPKRIPANDENRAASYMGFGSLKTQNNSSDFKEAHVNQIKHGLTYAYLSGSSGQNPAPGVLDHVAKKHLGFMTLKERNSDSMDNREVSTWGVKSAIHAAYAAGLKAAAKAKAGPAPVKKPGGIVGNLAAGPTYNAQGQMVAFTHPGAPAGTAPNTLTVTKNAQGNVTKIETSVKPTSSKAAAAVKAEKAVNAAAAAKAAPWSSKPGPVPSFLINQSTATASTPISKIKKDWQKYSKAGDSNIAIRKKGGAFEAYYSVFSASQGPSHKQMLDAVKHVFPNAQAVLGGMGMNEHAFVGGAKSGSKKDTYRYVKFILPVSAPKAAAGTTAAAATSVHKSPKAAAAVKAEKAVNSAAAAKAAGGAARKAAKSKTGGVKGQLPKVGEVNYGWRNGAWQPVKIWTSAGWVPYGAGVKKKK